MPCISADIAAMAVHYFVLFVASAVVAETLPRFVLIRVEPCTGRGGGERSTVHALITDCRPT